jgi:RNA polymerase sigma-70 factor (ECF subfamily)
MEKAPAIDAIFGDVFCNVFGHVVCSHPLLPQGAPKNSRGNKILDWLVLDNLGNHSVFEQAVLPHLDAAYNLARWLTRNDHDAEDVAQEACLRAMRFFDGFRGGAVRPWLLTIVRNTYLTWLQKSKVKEMAPLEHDVESGDSNPEEQLIERVDGQSLRQALDALPAEYREVIVLRELEELSYKEIAEIAGIPIGTVMSRLARARRRLQESVLQGSGK